jgi:von Willebrand factor type D domain
MSPRRGFILIAALLLFGVSQSTSGALTTAPAAKEAARIAKTHAAWRQSMQELRVPHAGCFKARFPRVGWRDVSCVAPPRLPYPPKRGHRAFTVGNGNDFAGRVSGPVMSAAEGSFDSVTGVTSETGQVGGAGGQVANIYSLQLNTDFFTTSVCGGSPNPGCRGWEQFLYSSNAQAIFIQYWLIRYNATCPAGWNTFMFSGSTDTYCWRNGAGAATVARQPITNLINLRLGGSANVSGNDTVTMWVGSTATAASNLGSMLNLGAAWRDAEFTIVGDCCSSQANFNAGSTIVVRTTVHNGTTNAPTCVLEGFTGETNNLNLVGTAAVGTGPSPAVVSTQSNTLSSMASCAAANGTGDPHLTTFKGLLYDFQAAGDFVLAETRPNFIVQARMVSGAPTWPNASVNKAVATRMGKTRVAVCLPRRVEVNGKAKAINPGSPLVLPTGVDVSRTGNVYLIRGPNGESLRAELHDDWIDVSVGLGRRPYTVRGLLANANNNVHQVATRAGTTLTWPIAFKVVYYRYGDSWRVKPGQSLLCKAKRVEHRNPRKPFYAEDLKKKVAQRARATCRKAGVRRGPLLEACTLDVAVIGRAVAARAYVGARAPVAVGKPRRR